MSNRSAPRALAFVTVDVFAEHPLEGNQLAIFDDAHDLSTDDMQRIARETNLSETTFILPADPATELRDGIRVRIFTTEEELPFAGHPTLGTATWLRLNRPYLHQAVGLQLLLNIGPISVTFEPPDPGRPGLFCTMQQPDPSFGDTHHAAEIAQVLGLAVDDLDATLPIQTVSTGVPFCIVPLRSIEALSRLAIPQPLARAWLRRHSAHFFYVIASAAPSSGAHWRARMQFASTEDPATGSACGCAIAYLVWHRRAASGELTIFEQGIEILRPSRISACATLAGNTVTRVLIGGRTIPVASGHLFLP